MKCRESVEVFTYKDKFGRGEYLIVDHVNQLAYIVKHVTHFDNMRVLQDLVRFMNEFELFGERDFATLDVNLRLSRYAAVHADQRRFVNYVEIAERLRQTPDDAKDSSS